MASKTTARGKAAAGKPPADGRVRPQSVRRRRVLYIHGFDPRGPGPYHAMFVEEAARASALSGGAVEARTIKVGTRRRGDGMASDWTVSTGEGANRVEADYTFLRWDDRVRARWSKNELNLLGEVWGWTTTWGALGYFDLARKQARALWLAMISVPVVVGLYLLSALVVISVLGFLAGALFHSIGLPTWAGAIPALLTLFFAPAIWRWLEEKLNLCWLSRCFTYMLGRATRPAEDLAERDQVFAQAIATAVADPAYDEVLVVGHSLGALHAVSALSRAMAADPQLGRDGRLSLMTLGQPIAIFTALPQVADFRRELQTVAAAKHIGWLDVTSPSDPASACHLDPFTDIEAASKGRLIQRSPRFHLFLTKARFQAIRRDPISFHFQYLRAPDLAGGFDYFAFVGGAERLMDHPWTMEAAAKEAKS